MTTVSGLSARSLPDRMYFCFANILNEIRKDP
jgi:hypothetical protein